MCRALIRVESPYRLQLNLEGIDMELKISIQVAETSELKILMAEFEWLCELLADEASKNTIDPDFNFQKSVEVPDPEILETRMRIEKRLDRFRDVLADEVILILMTSVLNSCKSVGVFQEHIQ